MSVKCEYCKAGSMAILLEGEWRHGEYTGAPRCLPIRVKEKMFTQGALDTATQQATRDAEYQQAMSIMRILPEIGIIVAWSNGADQPIAEALKEGIQHRIQQAKREGSDELGKQIRDYMWDEHAIAMPEHSILEIIELYASHARQSANNTVHQLIQQAKDEERVLALEAAEQAADGEWTDVASRGACSMAAESIRAITTPDLIAARKRIESEAHATGIAEGLEMAAVVCEKEGRDIVNVSEVAKLTSLITQTCQECAKAIRAIQIPPAHGEAGEAGETPSPARLYWNHRIIDGVPHICRGEHHRSQGCIWEPNPTQPAPAKTSQAGEGVKEQG